MRKKSSGQLGRYSKINFSRLFCLLGFHDFAEVGGYVDTSDINNYHIRVSKCRRCFKKIEEVNYGSGY